MVGGGLVDFVTIEKRVPYSQKETSNNSPKYVNKTDDKKPT